MQRSTLWSYVRVLIALPFLGGFVFMAFAFIPLTDDFGNPIYQSLLSRSLIFAAGLLMTCAAFVISVPSLLKLSGE